MQQFIRALLRNTGKALESEKLTYRFELHRGRLLIHGDAPQRIAAVTSRIFGIVDVAVCVLTGNNVTEIEAEAVRMTKTCLSAGTSFAVRARRQGVPGITSQELASHVGTALCREYPDARVDLDHPDYEIFIEMREFGTLIYDHHLPAPGSVAPFVDIHEDYGATATMMTEYLRAAKIAPSPRLATALFYGIKTDTDNFVRASIPND
ncbi:MAG: hypothetical protein HGA55_03940, partial [Methanoregulaceae archaeon]|nr:hypothetical protein [Methanoregulaceae archaeon]